MENFEKYPFCGEDQVSLEKRLREPVAIPEPAASRSPPPASRRRVPVFLLWLLTAVAAVLIVIVLAR